MRLRSAPPEFVEVGELSARIQLVADARARPVRFALTGGQRADPGHTPADRYRGGSRHRRQGMDTDICHGPRGRSGHTAQVKPEGHWEYGRGLYKQRNLIERAFNKLKQWRRIATMYGRKSLQFLSALHLVASVTWD